LGQQPIAVPDHAPPPQSREQADGARTIVVVEDDGLVRELIHRVLLGAGYTTLNAQNGQEALELLAAHPGNVDIILTDLVMPQMGGRELIDRLRLQWPSLKVLGMSGYTDRVVARHGIIQSCDAFLQKPFTPRILLQRIDEVLRRTLDS
jgi:CheY-like chemotaxis protein